MITGIMAVRNIALGEKNDLWSINEDQFYQEEIQAGEIRVNHLSEKLAHELTRIFPKMDPIAFGLALGVVCGLAIFLVTIFMTLKADPVTLKHLQIFDNILPGYHLSGLGSLTGLFDGLLLGFIAGYVIAIIRNFTVYLSAMILDRRIRMKTMKQFLDDV